MRSYSNFSLGELLDAFATAVPAPGGGSAAALAGAMGASLLLMAVGIRRSRSRGAAESPELTDAADRLQSLKAAFAALIDRDAEAYAAVIAARRLPVSDEESRIRQRAALASAMRTATEAPLETLRACRRALHAAPVVAAHSTKGTRGDVAVAIELLRAAARGAGLTIDANLASLEDADYAAAVKTRRETLGSESAADAEHGLAQLSGGPG
jgi:formiminotetrahydrofolate cyclodeaminase